MGSPYICTWVPCIHSMQCWGPIVWGPHIYAGLTHSMLAGAWGPHIYMPSVKVSMYLFTYVLTTLSLSPSRALPQLSPPPSPTDFKYTISISSTLSTFVWLCCPLPPYVHIRNSSVNHARCSELPMSLSLFTILGMVVYNLFVYCSYHGL